MHCQLWYLYIDRCVPFQIMSNQLNLTTGGLKSSCRNISRMINGNRMRLSSISSLIAKGLNVNKVFLFFTFNIFANISKNLFLLCHWRVLCVGVRTTSHVSCMLHESQCTHVGHTFNQAGAFQSTWKLPRSANLSGLLWWVIELYLVTMCDLPAKSLTVQQQSIATELSTLFLFPLSVAINTLARHTHSLIHSDTLIWITHPPRLLLLAWLTIGGQPFPSYHYYIISLWLLGFLTVTPVMQFQGGWVTPLCQNQWRKSYLHTLFRSHCRLCAEAWPILCLQDEREKGLMWCSNVFSGSLCVSLRMFLQACLCIYVNVEKSQIPILIFYGQWQGPGAESNPKPGQYISTHKQICSWKIT